MRPFTTPTPSGPAEFSRGSISMPLTIQSVRPDSIHRAVTAVSRLTGVPIHGASSTMSVEGPDLGSRSFRPVRAPRVLFPMGEGLSAYEAGQLWHLLDQRVGMPVTKVDVTDMGRADLSEYDVLILVSGNLGFLGGARLEEIRTWIRGGGTLVAIRGAASWAAENELTPNIGPPGVGRPVDEEPGDDEDRRDYADADDLLGASAIGGSIWEADLDTTHPLGFGYVSRFLPVWRDHSFFFEPSANRFSTVAKLVDEDPHLSGYISAENRTRLAGSPSVLADGLGQGTVVLLVDNPNFRGYWRGTNRLFLNAVFFGDHIEVP